MAHDGPANQVIAADDHSALPPAKRKGGRPRGRRNKTYDDLAALIRDKGKPIEFLIKVARGNRIRVSAEDNPNAPAVWRYPSMDQRVDAAKALARKILPDMRATEISGPDGEPLLRPTASRIEVAKAVIAVLSSGTASLSASSRRSAPSDASPRGGSVPAAFGR